MQLVSISVHLCQAMDGKPVRKRENIAHEDI